MMHVLQKAAARNTRSCTLRRLVLRLVLRCLLGAAALSLIAAKPAAAQNLTYTFTGATFNDGGVATGYFDYNPTTRVFGNYDVTTTNGVGDGFPGATYETANPDSSIGGGNGTILYVVFFFKDSLGDNFLDLYSNADRSGPGTYAITPGYLHFNSAIGSAQSNYYNVDAGVTTRLLTAGNLVVTPAAVPEASSCVSFALLLVLSGALFLRACKRTRQAL